MEPKYWFVDKEGNGLTKDFTFSAGRNNWAAFSEAEKRTISNFKIFKNYDGKFVGVDIYADPKDPRNPLQQYLSECLSGSIQ